MCEAGEDLIGEGDLEGVDPNDELFATKPRRTRKMFAYDWSEGFVSPFLPSPDGLGERMLDAQGVDAETLVCDLGSGEGDLMVEAVKRGAHAVGFELSGELNLTATRRLQEHVGSSFELFQRDFLSPDLDLEVELKGMLRSRPSCKKLVLVMFLLPEALVKLLPALKRCFPMCSALLTVRWPLPIEDSQPVEGRSMIAFPPPPCNNGHGDGYWMYTPRASQDQ